MGFMTVYFLLSGHYRAMSDLESSPPTTSSASSHPDTSDSSSLGGGGGGGRRRDARGKSVTKIILSSSSNEAAFESDSGYSMSNEQVVAAAASHGLEDDLSLLDLSSMPAMPPAMMADSEAGPDIADDEFRPANPDIFKERPIP